MGEKNIARKKRVDASLIKSVRLENPRGLARPSLSLLSKKKIKTPPPNRYELHTHAGGGHQYTRAPQIHARPPPRPL